MSESQLRDLLSPEEIRAWKKATREALLREVREHVERERPAIEAEAWKPFHEEQARRQAHLDQQKAEIARLEGEIAADDLRARKRDAATSHGLPESLAERLVGESAEELAADAAGLAASFAAAIGHPVIVDPEVGYRGAVNPNGAQPPRLSSRQIVD